MMQSTDSTEDKPAQDLFLLFSILALILAHPVLDGPIWGRALLGFLTFVPLVIAMVRMSQKKELVWPFAALLGSAFVCAIVAYVSGSHALLAIQFALATIAFAVSVAGLFTYVHAGTETRITAGHLYTAASIYLLLMLAFFTLYSCITAIFPDAFEKTSGGNSGPAVDLLYFSMVTLTTVGYGDIVPVRGIVRMLAGLEATTGVLYVAITVSILVSGYKGRTRP
jgi:Ion channel